MPPSLSFASVHFTNYRAPQRGQAIPRCLSPIDRKERGSACRRLSCCSASLSFFLSQSFTHRSQFSLVRMQKTFQPNQQKRQRTTGSSGPTHTCRDVHTPQARVGAPCIFILPLKSEKKTARGAPGMEAEGCLSLSPCIGSNTLLSLSFLVSYLYLFLTRKKKTKRGHETTGAKEAEETPVFLVFSISPAMERSSNKIEAVRREKAGASERARIWLLPSAAAEAWPRPNKPRESERKRAVGG